MAKKLLDTIGIEQAKAIQLLRLHNPALVFQGFAYVATATPAHVANKAWIAAETGTIFGITVIKGQVIEDDGTNFSAKNASVLQKNSWPFSEKAECLSNANFQMPVARRFFVDMYLQGNIVAGKQYSPVVIKKNSSGVWEIRISEETPVTSGNPPINRLVCATLIASNPENGDKITIHNLLEVSSSGITGKIAVRWSAIPSGSAFFNLWASGTALYRLDEEIFDKNKSTYIYPIERVSENNAQVISDVNEIYELDEINALFNDAVKYDSYSSQVNWTTQNGGSAYASPFTGWGATFNKTGKSFNAIKLPAIKRGSVSEDKKWVSIQLVVKDFPTSSTVIALSKKIELDPALDSIENILFPLMDPALQNFITLNDSSFSGSTYFIGFCYYAGDGTYAFGGVALGEQSNFANSYYISNKTFEPSVPTSWAAFSGNYTITMEHALLVNPRFVKKISELGDIESRVLAIETEGVTSNVEIVLPDKLNAIVGDTLQVYFRSIIKAPNPYIYDILVSCTKGKQTKRYYEYTPVSADIGTTTLKIEIKNEIGVVVGTKICNLITKSAVKSPTANKKILCVGDSITSYGVWSVEASRRLIGSGGSPAGLGFSNISFLGRKTGSGIGWEGTGGWTWSSYTTAGVSIYRFTVSGIITPPSLGAIYSNNGKSFTISEVNLISGIGNISGTGTGTPSASGTLTKVSGSGDSTISFSLSSTESGNPFWNAGVLDFQNYVTNYMAGGCDVIYFLLTWNGLTNWKTDFSSIISTAKTLINHIHAAYPSCKIKIMGIQLPSLNGGMGANYGATGTGYADTYGMSITALNMNKAYQDWCNEASYSAFLEYVDVASQFDSENNMPETEKPVNIRSVKIEKVGTNGVHPTTEGYYQIADVVFRNFVANYCQ